MDIRIQFYIYLYVNLKSWISWKFVTSGPSLIPGSRIRWAITILRRDELKYLCSVCCPHSVMAWLCCQTRYRQPQPWNCLERILLIRDQQSKIFLLNDNSEHDWRKICNFGDQITKSLHMCALISGLLSNISSMSKDTVWSRRLVLSYRACRIMKIDKNSLIYVKRCSQ